MRLVVTPLIAGTMLFAATAAAQAQTLPSPAPNHVAPVELGGNFTGLFVVGAVAAAFGPEITVNLTDRNAIQLRSDMNVRRYEHSWSTDALYSVLYRYAFVNRPDSRSFVLVGVAGALEASHGNAYVQTTPAYSYTVGGNTREVPASTRDVPAYTHFDVSRPIIGVLGIGTDIRLLRRLSLHFQGEVGVTVYGVGARASGGLSVPIGPLSR